RHSLDSCTDVLRALYGAMFFFSTMQPPPRSTLFPYTTLFRSYPAVTNIGLRPTFEGDERTTVEAHLIDFSGDLYGKEVRLSFIRSEEHTSELQSRENLVCRLLLEKKKSNKEIRCSTTNRNIVI